MGKITGFMEFERLAESYEPPQERVRHWRWRSSYAFPTSRLAFRARAAWIAARRSA